MPDLARILVPVLIAGAGLFAIICALKDYRFFWEHRRAQFMVRAIGPTGAKIFYVTLGIVLVVVGITLAITGLPTE